MHFPYIKTHIDVQSKSTVEIILNLKTQFQSYVSDLMLTAQIKIYM
jgi:hypothetical protein